MFYDDNNDKLPLPVANLVPL